ncbi:lytic murein transglycosylase B [Marinobacter caseinilyticus]|uniref:lytic murein transglycosylase B n=1 Tax=Marinobacter caseinilyticus TaxID=2692195 RepID=UPI0014099BD9|nr:lytic murein transglycosylase B [Marinobacter caseinilyticus]
MKTQVASRCRVWLGAAVLVILQGGAQASNETEAGYAAREDGQAFIREMATQHGFSAEVLETWLNQAERKQVIINAISKPAEKTMEWHDYRRLFIRSEQVDGGRAFLAQYREAFDRAEAEYGVSRYIIAAIIGVETRYGRFTGKYRVLDALATLAFDYPPRSAFFRRELGEFLLMTREQGFDPLTVKGSYAGAMGFGQFISSSYRHYAIDFDGDSVADILTNPVDAIGSVAHYFSAHDWRRGDAVAEPVADSQRLPQGSPLLTRGLKPTKTVADYRQAGVPVTAAVDDSARARALRLMGANGAELWLTYHNFYVITRYNHSHLYGMAVFQLSRALGGDDV